MRNIARLLSISIALACFSGCMNLYTRCPGTPREITSIYQCSREMVPLSCVVMFPQMMSDSRSDAFYAENLLTIPMGVLCLGDAACEAVIDTVCLPFDYPVSRYRRKVQR